MIIAVVDDEASIRDSLTKLLKKDHEIVAFDAAEGALAHLEKHSVDLVITDYQLPGKTGIDLVQRGRDLSPNTSFFVITAHGSLDHVIQAIRAGADDFFTKPFDPSELRLRIRRLEEVQSWRQEKAVRSDQAAGRALVGTSKAMKEVREFIAAAGAVASPVVLLGQSGSGKELVARGIHESGPRRFKPFIPINCASLSEALMESELFGHEKGAFTGANAAKPGKFELANGGTLFLDEVGELPEPLQAKLLRVLQEKEFYRVGGVRLIRTDARVIVATHRNLEEMVSTGSFREDLYYRINILKVNLPSLRERMDDLPLLVDSILDKLHRELGKRVRLSNDAMSVLSKYPFPGNVRELQNILERVAVLNADGAEVPADRLPGEVVAVRERGVAFGHGTLETKILAGEKLPELIDNMENHLVQWAMTRSGGNQQKAADLLGLTRSGLQYKLRKRGGSKDDEGNSGEEAA